MEEQLFGKEAQHLAEVKDTLMRVANENSASHAVLNSVRLAVDNLDITFLLLSSLASVLQAVDEAVEEKVTNMHVVESDVEPQKS